MLACALNMGKKKRSAQSNHASSSNSVALSPAIPMVPISTSLTQNPGISGRPRPEPLMMDHVHPLAGSISEADRAAIRLGNQYLREGMGLHPTGISSLRPRVQLCLRLRRQRCLLLHANGGWLFQPTGDKQTAGDAQATGDTWTSLFSGSKLTAKGKPLTFISPLVKEGKPCAQLQQSEMASAAWLNSIILYVVGTNPTIANLHRFLALDWNLER